MDTEKTIFVRTKKFARLIDRLMDQTHTGVSNVIEDTDNISSIQGRIALYVFEASRTKPVYQKDIETHFDIRRSTVAIILKRMEKNGLVTRHASDVDIRMKIVRLTKKAEDMCPVARAEIEKAENHLTRGVTEQELAIFIETLEKMAKNII